MNKKRIAHIVILVTVLILFQSVDAVSQFAHPYQHPEKPESVEISLSDLRLFHPGENLLISDESPRNAGFMGTLGSKPGYAFLSSLILPGLGQAANENWIRAGVYAAVEATAIAVFVANERSGRKGEQRYMDYAHDHFSVIKYAQWMVRYNAINGRNVPYDNVVSGGFDLMDLDYNNFNYRQEWAILNLGALNALESSTLYYEGGNVAFSHFLDGFGSQQYYELISKYFQYGPGWTDWENGFRLDLGISNMSAHWQRHANIGADFNNELAMARNMISLLVVNHFISAMDAFISNKLHHHRIETSTQYTQGPMFTVGYRF